MRFSTAVSFLADNLVYSAAHFDLFCAGICLTISMKSLVKPVVGRLWSVLKPAGMLLAFFHTRDAGPRLALPPLPHCRGRHA